MTFEEWWDNAGLIRQDEFDYSEILECAKCAFEDGKAEGAREERDAYQSAYGQGYIEGQKAMRERAAACLDGDAHYLQTLARVVRALPIEGE